MMRWVTAGICAIGVSLSLAGVNAGERAKHRVSSDERVAVSDDAKSHVKRGRKAIMPDARLRNSKYARTGKAKKPHGRLEARSARVKAAARHRDLRVFNAGRPVAKTGAYRVGEPYVIAGRRYVPRHNPHYRAEGKASWYGSSFHGQRTANGEKFDMHALTAAHPTLPLPSYVRVTNLENNTSLVVRLNDRGPYRDGRLIDVSVRAAKLLGFYEKGLARVRVEYVGRAEVAGSGDRKRVATLRRPN